MEYYREFQEELLKLYESLVKKGMHPSAPFYFNVKKYIKLGVTIEDMMSFLYDIGIQNSMYGFEECFLDQYVDPNRLTIRNNNYQEYEEYVKTNKKNKERK